MVKLTAISHLYFSTRWLHSSAVSEYHITTTHIVSDPRLGWTEEGFWPDFAVFKHDYTQEFYRSHSVFTGKCPRTSKFRGVCGQASDWYTYTHTHTDRQTHVYTDATDDNTLRLKLASGKKLITDLAQTAEKWSKQVRSIPPVHTAGTLYRRYEVYK